MPKKEDRARPAGDGEAGKPARPALTEKQRIEARRARQSRSHRKSPEGNALSRGLRATGFEVRRTASFIGGGVIAALAALGPLFSSAGMGLVWLIERIGEGLKVLGRLTGRAVAALGRAVVAADRVITPHRALLLVAAIAAVLLAVSQFKGLGQIEIGQSGYSGFQDLARAPAIDHTTPAGVHTKILVPIAGLALVAVAVILLGGLASTAGRFSRFRRLASMVLVTIGLLTLAVALLVDLPDARDTTEAALAYSGVKAVLLSGFWLELAAGAALTVTGFALLFEPSPGRAREKRPQEEPGSRPGPGNPDESRERRRAERA
ncbi:MAG TPA: hypothetical protein PLO12_12405, partial [Solirubrobacterales bacterium]|nr:hypothetical protein [Solirubrobacterales bacterium]